MARNRSRFLFDQQDYELLSIVNEVLDRTHARNYLKTLFDPYLHPNGIKELAASKEIRVAYAMINLLDSLEAGRAEDRLQALRSVRDEVLHSSHSPLRYNTGRVLLQLMKELVRAHGDELHQLELAHDFRSASSGKPRTIRGLLRRYHLFEMPEEMNQVTFDDHVHDANTKGRKSPTHLIMDAWIKGIRELTIIHYNHVPHKAASELLKAAEIMKISVRIGVEFSARFNDRYVQLIWVPKGFSGSQDFLKFLDEPLVNDLMSEGRKVSEFQQEYVMKILGEFNKKHAGDIFSVCGFNPPEARPDKFLDFVGSGQASLLHLAKFISQQTLPCLLEKVSELRSRYDTAGPDEKADIERQLKQLEAQDQDYILEKYLSPKVNSSVPDINNPKNYPNPPELLKYSPFELIRLLAQLHAGFRVTLNLSDLSVADVLELLYDCQGMISHLEIFNLKDFTSGKNAHIPAIMELQRAVNSGNVIILKRVIRKIIATIESSPDPGDQGRLDKLYKILVNFGVLQGYYRQTPLKARIGSDSTGRTPNMPGMGLAIRESLPLRTQREIRRHPINGSKALPLKTTVNYRTTYRPETSRHQGLDQLYRVIRNVPLLRFIGLSRQNDWIVDKTSLKMADAGNVMSLGGVRGDSGYSFSLKDERPFKPRTRVSLKYMNGGLKNALKVVTGFIPAFLTFYLTKDWWLLAWFGAVIWFGITCLRNIIQSVLGGGGIQRSPILRWSNFVSWDRIADSLMYTGFSVPLLDYLVKTLLLDHGFGVTVHTSPITLYSVMALANGLYISTHNIIRGLPRGAIVGNFFRSILSIPLAVAFSSVIGYMLGAAGVVAVDMVLQKWAAIISKAASDCMAGIIEGTADRNNNMKIRFWDYETKLTQLFDAFAQLELLYPEDDIREMLESPKEFIRTLNAEARNLVKMIAINALDLLYFWMYQPRARKVLDTILATMPDEDREILVRSQFVLQRHKEISQMFVDGLVGKNFSKALAFYLDRSREYLETMKKLADRGSGSAG